jgi:hypothetical protein
MPTNTHTATNTIMQQQHCFFRKAIAKSTA